MTKLVLIAGATGAVGRAVLQVLHAEKRQLRALARNPERAASLHGLTSDVRLADATDPAALTGVCDGVDAVFSSLGASVVPGAPDRRSYLAVDLAANRNLLAEAKRAGVRRFVYVSVFATPAYAATAYVRAHEEFVNDLKNSGLEYAVLRPTGLFSAFAALLPLVKKGRVPLVGDGASETNPLAEEDLALLVREALDSPEPRLEREVGGPEVLSRRQIAELAFAALEQPPRFLSAPAWSMRATAAVARPFNPRLGELLAFVTAVSTTRCVAPAHGARRLGAYLRARASA
jgi:uncharacterized protein YbjT (DUF2867 family)